MALLFGSNPAPSLNKRTCMTAVSLWTPPGGFSAYDRWTNCITRCSDVEIWGACAVGCRLSLWRTGFDPGSVLLRKYHWDMFLSMPSLSRISTNSTYTFSNPSRKLCNITSWRRRQIRRLETAGNVHSLLKTNFNFDFNYVYAVVSLPDSVVTSVYSI
jgi:hypothetical protein